MGSSASSAGAGLFDHDLALGAPAVAGADEAGRGCLAGPIVGAAVLFDRACLEDMGGGRLVELADSKKLTPRARLRIYAGVMTCAVRICVVARSAGHIDRVGIQPSNLECLSLALERVGGPAGTVRLVDGFALKGYDIKHRSMVKGDRTSAAVAAASVIAKVSRDRLMQRAAHTYPGYGFEGHKGYGSEAHIDAIERLGLSPIHRTTFRSRANDPPARAA